MLCVCQDCRTAKCGIDGSYVGEASEHSLFNTSPSLGRTRRMCATGEAAFDVAEEGRKLGCLSRLSSHVGAQSDRLGVLFDSKDSLGAEDEINIRNEPRTNVGRRAR